MEEAKRRNQDGGIGDPNFSNSEGGLSDKEIRERNDRLRFEELLKKGTVHVMNDYSSDGYLNRQQEEDEIDAVRKCTFAAFLNRLGVLTSLSPCRNRRSEQELERTESLKVTQLRPIVSKSSCQLSQRMPSARMGNNDWCRG